MMTMKRIVCLLLALILVLSILPPVNARAEETEEPIAATEAAAPTETPTETGEPTEAPTETGEPTETPTEPQEPTETPTEPQEPTEAPAELPEETWILEEAPRAASGSEVIASGTCGNDLTWTLDADGLMTVSGTGDISGYTYENRTSNPWWEHRGNIRTVVLEEGVTGIGARAFYDCDLTSISIPASVTHIGECCFTVSSLESVTVPGSVKSIDARAFSECKALTQVRLEEGLRSIGDRAFYLCPALTQIHIPSTVRTIWGNPWCSAYTEDITVAEGNPNYVTRNGALLNKEMTTLIAYAAGRTDRSFMVPETVTTILEGAFAKNTSLDSVTLPAGLKTVGSSAFSATKISQVHISDLSAWLTIEFANTSANPLNYGGSLCLNGERIRDLVIPQGVSRILPYAFTGADIESIVAQGSLTAIEKSAFYGCNNLIRLRLPEGLEFLGERAFSYCSRLWEVYIPQSVTTVEKEIFLGSGQDKPRVYCAAEEGPAGWDYYWYHLGQSEWAKVTWGAEDLPENYVTAIAVETPPDQTWYVVGEAIRLTGLKLQVQYSNGDVKTLGLEKIQDSLKLTKGSTDYSGIDTLWLFYEGQFASTNIIVHQNNGAWVLQPKKDYPFALLHEGTNSYKEWEYTCEGAEYLEFTFPAYYFIETDNDYIQFNDTYTYNGTKLAGKTIRFPGDTVTIELYSDGFWDIDSHPQNGTWHYGFAISSIYARFPAETVHEPVGQGVYTPPGCEDGYWTHTCFCGEPVIVPEGAGSGHTPVVQPPVDPSCELPGHTSGSSCSVCGKVLEEMVERPPLGHVYADGSCTYCGKEEPLASGSCGENISWELSKDGELVIYGSGELKNYWIPGEVPWDTYRSQIKKVVIREGVTSIGNYAFYGCSALTQVQISEGVTSIGKSAFQNCTSLGGKYLLTLPESLTQIGETAFYGCDVLKRLTVPAGVVSIGDYAFYSCEELKELILREGLESIGSSAFSGCEALTDLTLPTTVRTIGENAFSHGPTGTLTVPGTVEIIGANALKYAEFETVILEEGITTLESGAFQNSYCKNVVLPRSLKSIGANAFQQCQLEELTLPEGLLQIPEGMFKNSRALRRVTIPGTVSLIDYQAFYGCQALEEIAIPGSVKQLEAEAFGSCSKLSRIQFQGDAPAIGEDAFLDVTATAGYLSSAQGWTEEVKQSYGGDLTWTDDHTHSYTSQVQAPTCTEGGGTVYTCVCGDSYIKNQTKPLGHAPVAQGEKAPTCTEPGLTGLEHCSRCGELLKEQEEIPALGHEYGENDIIQAPTCTEEGRFGCTCSRCGETVEEAIPALGHTEVTDPAKEPTCTEPGLTQGKHCSVCQEVFAAQEEISALGHEKKLAETVAPGCLTQGYTLYSCTRCDQTWQEDFIDAIGSHTYTDDQDLTCDVCGDVRIPAIDTGTCGSGLTWILDEEYTLIIQGTGYIPSYQPGRAPWMKYKDEICNVVIAEGVTGIGNYAFHDCDGLISLTLPKSIVEMGMQIIAGCDNLASLTIQSTAPITGWAFANGCNALTSLSLPEGLTSIGKSAFHGCSALTSLTLPEGLTSIGESAFHGCSALTSLTLPEGLTDIGKNAFYGCGALTGLILPESITAIGEGVFYGCEALTDLILPEGITSIGELAFGNCRSLTSLVLPESLVTIEKRAFWYCDKLTSLTLPSGLTAIEDLTFYSCESLTSLVIPEGITSIGANAFDFCESLCSVTLPQSLTSIGGYAFRRCDSMTSVTIPKNVTYFGMHAFDSNALKQIRFEGSAPTFAENTFQFQTITVYYPGDDPSWTEDKLQNYGGKVTWLSHCGSSHVAVTDPAQAPTCTETGLTEGSHCDVCGLVFVPRTELPALGHEEVTDAAQAPTCTETGLTEGSHCAVCNLVLVPQQEIPMVPHGFQEGFCQVCGIADKADYELFGGKSMTFKLVNPETGKAYTAKQLSWSMNPVFAPYAKLTAAGKLTALQVVEKIRLEVVGTVIATGEEQVFTVDILPTLTQAEILEGEEVVNGKTLTMDEAHPERTFRLNAYPLDTAAEVTWSISDVKNQLYAGYAIDGNTLTVSNPTGKVGTVTIKATAKAGTSKTVSFKLSFGVFAESVEITTQETELVSGGKLKLAAVTIPEKPTKSGILWSLKDPADKAYVTLSSKGELKAKTVYRNTEVTLVAASKDGMASAEHTVTILPKDPGMLALTFMGENVTKATIPFNLNDHYVLALYAQDPDGSQPEIKTWKSSSPKTAIVDAEGVVTFLKKGSVTITATAADKRTASVTIKADKLASSVTITGPGEVASGKSITLKAALENTTGKKVTWTLVEGSEYAKLDKNGKLTANKDLTAAREVLVRADAADGSGVWAEHTVILRPLATGVQIYSQEGGRTLLTVKSSPLDWVRSNTTLEWDMNEGETLQLSSRVYPYYAEDSSGNAIQSVTWKSSSPKVAAVDEEGLVTCLKPGTTTITCTAADGSGKKVSFKLTLVKRVTAITLADADVVGGKSITLKPTILPGDTTTKAFYWEIVDGDTAFAKIDQKGKLTTKKVTAPKTVTVTVYATDGTGICGQCQITITPKTP